MQDTAQDARFAAEFNTDVDVEKIADVYADAFINAVAAEKQPLDEAVAEFESFIELLKSQTQFADVLASAMVSTEEKVALLSKAIAKQATPLFWNFLQTVAKRNRLSILVPIFWAVQNRFDEINKRIPVTVTTAAEIDTGLLQTLTAKLRNILGGEPVVRTVVDPNTLGGIVVKVGDTIYDASIRTQLDAVRRQMIEHSVQQIQGKR